MDDQQITLIDDNYFAGLVDSDFGIYMTKYVYKGKLMIRPKIKFVNTRFELAEYCSNVLHNNNINHHVSTNKATIGKDSKTVLVGRLSKCVEFADKWSTLSIVRRPQLELIREFCSGRIEYVNNFGWKFNNTPYTDRQLEIYDEIYFLNLNYNRDNLFRNYTFSWLAGMIDGDGSIYISRTTRACEYIKKSGDIKKYRYKKFTPCIKITTESDTARNNITELYDRHGIKYYIDIIKSKASKKLGKNKKKFCYSILVKEFDHLLLLINKLDGKLMAKQQQLELMKEYISVKKDNRNNTSHIEQIVKQMVNLNRNY